MSIFNEFFKKEKPVFTGLKFGFGSGPSGSGVAAFSASGGDSEYTYNGYKIHKFTQNGTFTVASGTATGKLFMVAGGGGGGGNHGGGGGAGGVVVSDVPLSG